MQFVIIWLNFTLNGSITISVRSLLAQRRRFICVHLLGNIPLCKHVVAKVTLVPCSVNLTGKREKGGHGDATINNARVIAFSEILIIIFNFST